MIGVVLGAQIMGIILAAVLTLYLLEKSKSLPKTEHATSPNSSRSSEIDNNHQPLFYKCVETKFILQPN
jgi:hypothetical protein